MDDELVPPESDVISNSNEDVTQSDSNALVSETEQGSSFFFENDVVNNIIASFTTESQLRLSSFLRKKVTLKFNSVTSCLFDEIEHDYSRLLMLNFRILPYDKYGLISFDFIFLHSVINLLYGGIITNNEPIMRSLGKSGIKIAQKVSEIVLTVFQESMVEYLRTNVKIAETSTHLSAVFKQEKYEKCYNISFCAYFDSLSCNINLIIPEKIFANSDVEVVGDTDEYLPDGEGRRSIIEHSLFDEKTRKDLIDSNVSVSIILPHIALKLRDVVNLKAGDIIPIGEPTSVFVTLNEKKLYKASAGQSNSHRAVKITEKL
jgi:flagellar motor switch protein FliM